MPVGGRRGGEYGVRKREQATGDHLEMRKYTKTFKVLDFLV